MNRIKANGIPKQVPQHGEVGQRDVGRLKEETDKLHAEGLGISLFC